MKALVCSACGDVRAIRMVPRVTRCACGKSWAELIDRLHIRYDGQAGVMGIFNDDIAEALSMARDKGTTWLVRAHIIAPGDGVLTPQHDYCWRCRGRSLAEAWRAHSPRPEPLPDRMVDGRAGFVHMGARGEPTLLRTARSTWVKKLEAKKRGRRKK